MGIVYKICAGPDWQAAVTMGRYRGSAVDHRDGFIHLSGPAQLRETANSHFAGQEGLVLVAFDEASLDNLRWEASRGGALFPHVYGDISTTAALWVKELPLAGGRHVFPDGIPA